MDRNQLLAMLLQGQKPQMPQPQIPEETEEEMMQRILNPQQPQGNELLLALLGGRDKSPRPTAIATPGIRG